MKIPLKLLIVDDSKLMRKAIADIFQGNDNIHVVGEAADGEEALDIILQLNPDVVTLDVEMPVMDGLATLKRMMIQAPTPAVMLSSLTLEGASVTFDALKYGAVDFIPKPSKLDGNLSEKARDIIRKVNLAADVEMETVQYIRAVRKEKSSEAMGETGCNKIIAVGAAEGGYGALLKIIPQLPPDFPAACLVVLHAAPQHLDAFASYLDEHCSFIVKRATDGLPLRGGVCYLGSGQEYVTVQPRSSELFLQVEPAPFTSISERKGSINMLMFSVVELMGNQSAGVILSGAGEDGVEGLAEIVRVGGKAVVQDPKSCMYKEMAKSALDRFKADLVVSDAKMASAFSGLF